MKKTKPITQAQVTQLQKLSDKKYRERFDKFIIEGPHLITEAVNSEWIVESILLRSDIVEGGRFGEIIHTAREKDIDVFSVGSRDFEKLSGTISSQGVLAIVMRDAPELSELWKRSSRKSVIVALNKISDPGNVGTIIRSCAWFGVDALLLDQGSVDLYNPKVVRSTMGAFFHLPVGTGVNMVDAVASAKSGGFTVCTTLLDAKDSLDDHIFGNRVMLLFGSEAHGVDKELVRLADVSIKIPRIGKGESLNVAVSCGIILHKACTATT